MVHQVSLNNFGTSAAMTDEMSPFQVSQIQSQCQQLLAALNTKPSELLTPNASYQVMANTTLSSPLPTHSILGASLTLQFIIHKLLHLICHIQFLLPM